jgi:hypothetical protein
MKFKIKKMNFKMMLLADCISPNATASPELVSLLGYIDALSLICEIKATAYHDVTSTAPGLNNLFKAWYLTEVRKQGLTYSEAEAAASVAWKAKFLEWIEGVCGANVSQVVKNRHYNARLF